MTEREKLDPRGTGGHRRARVHHGVRAARWGIRAWRNSHNLDWTLEGGVLVDLFPQRADNMGEAVSLGLPPFAEY